MVILAVFMVMGVGLGCRDVLISEVGSERHRGDSESREHSPDASRSCEELRVAPGVVLCPRILKVSHE